MFIYEIRNVVNNKVYIGQTTKIVNKRWVEHQYKLNKNCHENDHLQKAWNKYGKNKFIFKILRVAKNIKELNRLEELYIKKNKNGYNIRKGGNNKSQALISKLKISKTLKPGGWPDLMGPDGKIYNVLSLATFCKEHNLTASVLNKVMIGKCRHHKGWKLPNTDISISKEEYRSKLMRPQGFPRLLSPDGKCYEIKTLSGFAKEHNLFYGTLCKVISGERRQHRGWTIYNNLTEKKSGRSNI